MFANIIKTLRLRKKVSTMSSIRKPIVVSIPNENVKMIRPMDMADYAKKEGGKISDSVPTTKEQKNNQAILYVMAWVFSAYLLFLSERFKSEIKTNEEMRSKKKIV